MNYASWLQNYEDKYEVVTLANGHILLKPRHQRSIPGNIKNLRINKEANQKYIPLENKELPNSYDKENMFDDWINKYKESAKENSFIKKNAFLTGSESKKYAGDSKVEGEGYRHIDDEDDDDDEDSFEQSGNGIIDAFYISEKPNLKEWNRI